MIVIVAFLLAAQQAVMPSLDVAQLDAASTGELATALLPPEQARDVVSHSVDRSWVVSPRSHPQIRFVGRVRQRSPEICHRIIYLVPVGPIARLQTVAPAVPIDEIRLSGECVDTHGATYAHIQPGVPLEQAEAALLQLEALQRAAGHRAPRI